MGKTSARYAAASAVVLLCTSAGTWGQAGAPRLPGVLGPPHDVAIVARFGGDPASAFTAASGPNVTYTLTPDRRIPGIPQPVLAAQPQRNNLSDHEGGHNWFSIARKGLDCSALPGDTDGFRFVLGSSKDVQWWISVSFSTDSGEAYSLVLTDSVIPANHPITWFVPFARFLNGKKEPLTLEKARAIRSVTMATSSPGPALLIDRIGAYHRDTLSGWLDFVTSHPTNNLFQRGEAVTLTFTVGGTVPSSAAGLRYEVRGYDGKVAASGKIPLTGAARYTFPSARYAPGYYEVSAYWTDSAGRDVVPFSCIRSEGTMPDGIGTFSVLPHTVAENIARSRRLGYSAFFGLHGDFLGLADFVGLTWRFDYSAWVYQEPTKPDRSSGTAPWAETLLKEPPKPPYREHIQPFTLNLGPPQWARTPGDSAPGFRWDDAMALVRDTVKVEKHLYPHMPHRLYGGLWEVDLNNPLYGPQRPVFAPADIAETYRHIHDVVKAEDPAGMVIGPCSSVIRPDWFEQVFKAGVLDNVDGIETHGYTESAFSPEADDLPGRIRALNALMRKYHHGKVLPIYITELGQPGVLGSVQDYRSQAARMVRCCIMLKGEGVRVFLPFYGIDYDWSGYWGFLWNLDVDGPAGPWSTKRTSPKPMVNAVAACADMLEGARPIGRLTTVNPGVWAYSFRRGTQTITAVWAPGGPRTARVPMKGSAIEVVDMMGHVHPIHTSGGVLRLSVGEEPTYVPTRSGQRPVALHH